MQSNGGKCKHDLPWLESMTRHYCLNCLYYQALLTEVWLGSNCPFFLPIPAPLTFWPNLSYKDPIHFYVPLREQKPREWTVPSASWKGELRVAPNCPTYMLPHTWFPYIYIQHNGPLTLFWYGAEMILQWEVVRKLSASFQQDNRYIRRVLHKTMGFIHQIPEQV